jgi:NADH pyrophosphatase NudC (nudix superfamily)
MSRPQYQYCPLCRSALAPGQHGGKQRLACANPSCGFIHWDNPIPVVGAIVERDGHVLLVRSHGFPETWYALVTGFLEAGESPEHGVLREVEEELGIRAELQSFVGAYPFELRNQIIFVYHVLGGAGPIRLCEEELADWKAVPLAELRPWPLGTGPALRDWLASRGYHPPVVALGAASP